MLKRYYRSGEDFLFSNKKLFKCLCFTNGCFDLLHAGHVNYLEALRSIGDFLIVGLNSDASVTRLKGSTRPIQDELSRATVLCGLRSVDAVIKFNEDTPLRLIKLLKPNILAKGGDYSNDMIVGSDVVQKYGGKVVIIPFSIGHSTSNIIECIKNNVNCLSNFS